MELHPAILTFVAESRELLREMEGALLQLEKTPDNADALNAVFRAAHTIKGSSGIFGFDDIVAFTHLMESVLDDVRAGDIVVDGALTALFLSCGDQLSHLIDQVEDGGTLDAIVQAEGKALAQSLSARLERAAQSYPRPAIAVEAEAEVESLGGKVASDTWHISLRFGKDVLRNGMDPLSFLQYLGTLGDVAHVTTLFDAMPAAREMDAESCYVGLEIDFSGAIDKQTIENVFEFVRDDCVIRILPPHSRILEYIKLMESLPEEKSYIGELLVNSGALTQNELEEGLLLQMRERKDAGAGGSNKLGQILVGEGMVQNELVDAALEKQRTMKEHRAKESSFVRLRSDKLDELITLVGEMVIACAGNRLLAQRSGLSDLIESTSGVEQLVEQVRDSALKLRMVPIGETFGRFKRVVRDLGAELGKEVELSLTGVETELDKSMIEKIVDPLTHLVRNALDHGIETPAVRRQYGKPALARLSLNAYHDSGTIVIEVGDDGMGLDREKILKRALGRGLIEPGQELTTEEIYRLIMAPGFSTADEVTNVSGRGMGMDVVVRNVEALRGTVTIDSEPGEGTTVIIRLPLTLAIIDGFLVGIGKPVYVVPLDMVVECLELTAEDRAAIGNRDFMNLRGQILPLLRLRDVFEVKSEPAKRENIVVVQYAGQQTGLLVDALLGEFQTVIKPLGRLFERLSGISGSTILGNGAVALILDVPALVKRAADADSSRQARLQGRKFLESP
jgi:two-component system, chemotaxis family, sensor kinase CheA